MFEPWFNSWLLGRSNGDRKCVTVIETPQFFSGLDVVENAEMISERCFNFTLIAIYPRSNSKPLLDYEREVLVSMLSLMSDVYTDSFWDNLGFAFMSTKNQGK